MILDLLERPGFLIAIGAAVFNAGAIAATIKIVRAGRHLGGLPTGQHNIETQPLPPPGNGSRAGQHRR